jgi:hypothetical protein
MYENCLLSVSISYTILSQSLELLVVIYPSIMTSYIYVLARNQAALHSFTPLASITA